MYSLPPENFHGYVKTKTELYKKVPETQVL